MNNLEPVRKLIKECQKSKNPYLDIGNYGITNLKSIPELFDCDHLETLILSRMWNDNEAGRVL